MVCPGCGEKNREGARFCTYCGTTLALRCPVCDNEVVPGGRFCDACGASVNPSLQAPPTPAPSTGAAARKVVTVLFADLSGSTALEERMDAESVRSILDRFYAAMRAEVERFGGRVVKFTGDGVMAAFGVPDVHEDDAVRAVDAALAMREELEQLASDLSLDVQLNIGVNTGEVVVSDVDDDVVGDAVNVAARLEGAATDGEILVGEETWRLTRATSRYEPVQPLMLKGKSEPVPAYRLLSVDERTSDSAAAPFVGRDAELGRLLTVFQDAVDANAARLVTIIGSPGLGKTRLARELMAELSDSARVRETRCDPAGESTFAPIADALRAAIGISELDTEDEVIAKITARFADDDPDRDRIAVRAAAILGVGEPGSTEETFWAIRRLIEEAAASQPVVLVFDDVHWAEPLMLDLVEHLAEWIKTAPVLIVGTARPELRDLRPSLAEGGRAADVIALEGLNRSATAQLALNLLGTDELPSELLAKIPASTEGNPLFVRELVRMLVDDGVLMRSADGWSVTVDVEAIQVPPTIASLLSARVDRLRNDERTVVELASVVGKEFYRGALVELAPSGVKDLVDGCLESLRRKELVEPVGTYWIDEPVYRFHHVLIRDAAYRRLLKEARAELHERVAAWLQDKTVDVLGEHDELLGYHLEQAHEYKRQLGRPDDELGCRAAALLHTAAQRALDRDDLPAAAALSGRALDRLPLNDDTRAEVLLIRCEALLSMGDVARGAGAVSELDLFASSARLRAWVTCFSGHLANLTSPERADDVEARVAAAATELAALGDQAGAAKAHTVRAQTLATRGRFAECEAVLDDALTAARAANDRRRITATLGLAPHAQLWGPNVVSRAGGRCLDVVRLLRITTGSPAVEATSLRCQAVLEAFRGRADAARRMLRSARRTLTELGLEHELIQVDEFAGIVDLVDGDAAAAAAHLRAAYDGYKRAGVDVSAGQLAAELARARLLLGEEDLAAELVDESEVLAGSGVKAAIDRRAVKAELLARRGEFDEARRLAEEAVAIAAQTDALFDHGTACRSLAAVLRAAGDAAGAQGAEDRARALFERKGATALLEPVLTVEVTASSAAAVESHGELPPNDAVGTFKRWVEAFEARDWVALAATIAEDVSFEDRRPGFRSLLSGRDVCVENNRAMAEVVRVTKVGWSVVATRGSRLALLHGRLTGDDPELFGEVLSVVSVNADGAQDATIVFEPEDLATAFAELDERYLRGELRAHADQFRGVIAFIDRMNDREWERFRPLFTPDAHVVDRTPAGRGEMTVDRFLSSIDELVALTSELCMRITVVHAVADRVTLIEAHNRGLSLDGAEVDLAYQTLFVHDSDKLRRVELFPAEHLDLARARFEEVRRQAKGSSPLENTCVSTIRGFYAAHTERDFEALRTQLADDVSNEDRRSTLMSTMRGRDTIVEHMRTIADLGGLLATLDVLAVRGERLALLRMDWWAGAPEDGYSVDLLMVHETGDDGRLVAFVTFDPDDAGAAFAELDDRYAAGEGRVDAALVRLIGEFGRAYTARDLDGIRSVLAEDLVVHDHRPASSGHLDRDGLIAWTEAAFDLTAEARAHAEAYEVLEPGRALLRFVVRGTTRDGVAYDTDLLIIFVREQDRIVRGEQFLVDQLDEAMARFRELTHTSEGLENLALRAIRESDEGALAQDWERVRAVHRDDVVLLDARPGLRHEVRGIEARIADLRAVTELGAIRLGQTPVAIRGERLALYRTVVETADATQVELLGVVEVDEDGLITSATRFEPSQFDEALAHLDSRYEGLTGTAMNAPERCATVFCAAVTTGDWDMMRLVFADDVVLRDHRRHAWGEERGVDALRLQFASAADVVGERRSWIARFVEVTDSATLVDARVEVLTADGSRLDNSRLSIGVVRDGLITRLEYFAPDAMDDARARFHDLVDTTARTPFNASARVAARFASMFNARDWEAIARVYADDVIFEDRRAGLMTSMRGRDAQVDQMKVMAELGTRDAGRTEPLAIRGERLVLLRGVWSVTGDNDTAHEIETLLIQEIDNDARICALVVFAPEDPDAAFAELDARYGAGEGAPFAGVVASSAKLVAAWNARDWPRMTTCFAQDALFVDRRPASFEDIRGRERIIWLAQQALAPDYRHDVVGFHAISRDAYLNEVRARGTNADGGSVELRYLHLAVLRDGLVERTERFALDQLDVALSRFEELEGRAGSFRPAAFENAATRFLERLRDAMDRRDMDAFIALHAKDFVHDDRRSGIKHVTRGLDQIREYAQTSHELGYGTFRTAETLATRGERLCLTRRIYRDPRNGPDFEAEQVIVDEVDADGRVVHAVVFDPDDVDEAFRELDDRYVRQLGPRFDDVLGAFRRYVDAYNARDWVLAREQFADDFVLVDHRPASLGTLGPDGLIDAVSRLADLADLRLFIRAIEDIAPDAALALCQFLGSTEDGAPIELLFYFAGAIRDGKATRIEFFPVEQHDAAVARFNELALARFDELELDLVGELQNEALRIGVAAGDAVDVGDWEEIRQLYANDLVTEDRRAGVHSRAVGVEAWIENFRTVRDLGFRSVGRPTVVAVRGERLALGLGSMADPAGNVLEALVLFGINDERRMQQIVYLDPDDVDAAFQELDHLYAVGEGRPHADVFRLCVDQTNSYNERDWETFRSRLHDDLPFVDHRAAGAGTLTTADAHVDYLRALVELTPDVTNRLIEVVRISTDRILARHVIRGSTADGAQVELAFFVLYEMRDGRFSHMEVFPLDRRTDAIARFDGLAAQRPRASSLANVSTRHWDRVVIAAFTHRDWATCADLIAEDVDFVDRRSGLGTRIHGRMSFIDQIKIVAEMGPRVRVEIIAVRGDRLALMAIEWYDPDADHALTVRALHVHELDDDLRVAALVVFDPDDLDAALDDLEERFVAVEGAPYADALARAARQRAALKANDWGTYRSLFADNVVLVDHRPASLGEMRGVDAVVEAMQAYSPLMRDLRPVAVAYHALSPDRSLTQVRATATAAHGGVVEMSHLRIQQLRDGLVARIELFPVDRLDDARRRFDELSDGGHSRPDALTNAATRIFDIGAEAIHTDDWTAMRVALAEDVLVDDRRRGIHSRGVGPEAFIANYRTAAGLGFRGSDADVFATRGGRLALTYGAMDDVHGNVTDALILAEVDESGRAMAVVHFDTDDFDEAIAELDARFAAREGADGAATVDFNARILRAHNRGEWDTFRSMLHDDVVLLDHRPISSGRIESADEWLRYVQTMPEMTSWYRAHIRCYYALAPDRALACQRNAGTSLEGVDFDLELIVVTSMREGRLASIEFFLPEQLDEAQSRFEDLADQRSGGADVHDLENAASRAAVRSVAFILADDFTNYVAELAPDIFFDDRRALMTHESRGRDALIDQLRSLRSVGTVDIQHDVIAVRGERIALMRTRVVNGEIPGFDVDALSLSELDGEGRTSRVVVFDANDVDVALDELEERFLMAEGAHAEGIVRAAMTLRHAWNSDRWDEETLAGVVAEDLEVVDHRQLGAGTLHGRRAWVEYTSSVHTAGNLHMSHPSFLALSANAYVVRIRLSGSNDEGGPVDLDHLAFGSARDGWHIDRLEPFALEDAEQALRRFADAMSSDAQTESGTLLENTCTRTWDAMCVTFAEHRWDEHAKRMAPDIVFEDRRPGLQNVVEGLDGCLEVAKTIADIGPVLETKVLAVRGDRLALYHEHYHPATDEPRDVHVELLNVLEVDAKGRVGRATNFEVDDVDQAFAELDERFVAGEAGDAADMIRLGLRTFPVWNGQDWDALAALWDPDLVFVDHRQLSPGEVRREELLSMVKSLAELMPDVRHRIVAMPRGDRGIVLTQIVAEGTNTEGGRVDFSYLQIACAPRGRYTRIERFELDCYDDAVARYEQLRAAPSGRHRRLENDATLAAARFAEAFRDRDWDGLADTLSEDHTREDRRRGLGNTSGKEEVLAAWTAMAELGYGSTAGDTVAVRGTNLAVQRWIVTGENLFETGALSLFETDAAGRCHAMVYFDLDDLDAAIKELDERFAAGEGAPAAEHLRLGNRVLRAFNSRDWDAYRRDLAPGFVAVDHRPASLGEVGADSLIEANRTMLELVPGLHAYTSKYYAIGPRSSVGLSTISGVSSTGDPLDFSMIVVGISQGARFARWEYFPEDRLDEALARFEELGAVEGDRAIPPLSNAAVAANQRVFDLYAERDWDAIAAAYDDALVSEDRRLGLGSKGGKRGHLAQMQVESGIKRIDVIPLAIRGDRLSLCRYDFFGRSFDAVLIGLTEVTAEGLIVANVTFDEADLDAAYAELDERFAAGFGAAAAAGGVRFASRFLRAHNDRDWETFRSLMWDGVRFIDHRPISLGRIESAEDWLRSVKLLCEMSSTYRADIECYRALGSECAVVQLRNHGTSLEGVEFEMRFLAVTTLKEDRLASIEFFPIERLDDALATFHELRTDPGRMETFPGSRLDEALTRYEELSKQTSGAVENDASRAIRRTLDARARGDWETFATTLAPDCAVVDERHGLRSVSTGVQQVVDQARAIASLGDVEITCTVIATRGNRLSLDRRLYHGGPGVDMEVETLNVCEIDTEGRFRSAVVFDAEDLGAAIDELDARYVRGEGVAYSAVWTPVREATAAYDARDWQRMLDWFADDFVLVDHRPAYLGTITSAADLIESLRIQVEMVPELRVWPQRIDVINERSVLHVPVSRGAGPGGGEIEIAFCQVAVVVAGRITRMEFFPLDELADARRRFEELSADQI